MLVRHLFGHHKWEGWTPIWIPEFDILVSSSPPTSTPGGVSPHVVKEGVLPGPSLKKSLLLSEIFPDSAKISSLDFFLVYSPFSKIPPQCNTPNGYQQDGPLALVYFSYRNSSQGKHLGKLYEPIYS